MSKNMKLSPHPRLHLGGADPDRLKAEPTLPYLRQAARQVKADARRFARMPALTYRRDCHNELLGRAREVQTRVVTLLLRWSQTGHDEFRQAVIGHVEMMARWKYWSWITWRNGDARPDAIFDLSYGENSATLAVAYDWLHEGLSKQEKGLFLHVARRWPFAAARKHARPGDAWWFAVPRSNWNAVCAGGLGMLALAMYEDAAAAPKLLEMVEESIGPFMRHLDKTDGAWPEGVGYWNYGMRYAFQYLLSHERATGRAHPLLRRKGVRRTLAFPMDFTPHGQACSFGDVNNWLPLPFHYAAALRLDRQDVAAAIDARLALADAGKAGTWPNAAEWLILHPGTPAKGKATRKRSRVKLYKGLDWAVIADRMPEPRLYVSVRGGTTNVPHGHRDLLSFHCVVGDEKLITDVKPTEYLDTTFSPRREELFGIGPAAKNVILINGVGVEAGSALDRTEKLKVGRAEGIRLDATTAMGQMRDGPAARFCGRLILLLADRAFLIVDRAVLPHTGRMESRMHTFAEVKVARAAVALSGKSQRMRIAYACNVPAVVRTATTAPITPSAPSATVLRWCTKALHMEMTMATLLSPGRGAAGVELAEDKSGIVVTARGRAWRQTVRLTKRLRPARR